MLSPSDDYPVILTTGAQLIVMVIGLLRLDRRLDNLTAWVKDLLERVARLEGSEDKEERRWRSDR